MKKADKVLFWAGLAAVLFMAVPWLILGENTAVAYHDQLDGEMIAYILQAKHLGDGSVLPEFMGGADKTALTMPAPACVLLFLGGNYFAALMLMQLLGSLTGFVGMYLLAGEAAKNPAASFVSGVMYSYLPFLPVYGLAQYGLPLLLWCALQLRKGRYGRKGRLCCILYGVLYALTSSPVLVGFAVLGVLAVWIAVEMIRNRRVGPAGRPRGIRSMCLLWSVMLASYVAVNLRLLGQILGLGETFVSHKAEYALAGENFWSGWLNGLLYGGQHSGDYHLYFMAAVLMAAVVGLLWGKRADRNERELCRALILLAGCSAALAGVSALWNSEGIVALRERLGALRAFQLDRLLWLCPCLWYLMLACGVAVLLSLWGKRHGRTAAYKLAAGAGCLMMTAALGLTGVQILKNSDLKRNLQKLRDPDYPAISYRDYYAIGVLEQVEDFLRESTGLTRDQYRVVSLGIDPAAALYHGFYCLDGYSNNYSLEYKHSFRRVLAPELEKSDYLRDYYDDWGNRCYLFGAECPGYYTIEKGGFYFQDLELDLEALRELGGDYLFSAAYIANAEELGLRLLREEAFETEDSYYRIFLYGVSGR